jgi:curli biogenesis system outer membrane secretion channel CsgG
MFMRLSLQRKSILNILVSISIVFFLFGCAAIDEITKPTAKSTSTGGPTIEQARKEDYMGPKARVAVTKFLDKSAKGKTTGDIGDGMADMLSNALFTTNRFIVLERQSLGDVLQEQDLGASGRVKTQTAPRIGEIEGADLLIQGTITEFEPGTSGAGAGGGAAPPGGGIGIFLGFRTSYVAMIVKVIDAKTSRILASEQVEGKATDIGGLVGGGGGGLAGIFGGYSKTPMEKAIRIAVEETVKLIVAKTPAQYYRYSETSAKPAITPTTPEAPKPTPTPPTPPPSASLPPPTPQVSPLPPPRLTQVTVDSENLRDGPKGKIIGKVKKGTSLEILEEKGNWFHVRLEDGSEAWIWKASTSEVPAKTSPSTPPKPKSPM